MQILPDARTEDAPSDSTRPSLLHEWFVTYNPTYLASAALVLGGLTLVARSASEHGWLAGLGVAAVAEVYALALIASAAILRSIGERRAAVMVGLLAVLYQGDLTMHLETSAFSGAAGVLGVLAWVALFPIKLHLLARALGLTLSRSAFLVPSLGAAALGILPATFVRVPVDARTALTALVVFGVLAAFAWTSRDVRSEVGFDVRGRRAIRGVWGAWGVLALLHVLWWTSAMRVSPMALAPAMALVLTRWAAHERTVWLVTLATLVLTGWLAPALLSATAAMSCVALVLRALRFASERADTAPRATTPPYRGGSTEARHERPAITDLVRPTIRFGLAPARERERLLLGAASSLHLALSTLDGMHAPHSLAFDLVLLAVCIVVLARGRRAVALAPLAPVATHLAAQRGWLTMPASALELGVWSIASGFAVLGGSVAYSYAWRADATRAAEPHEGGDALPAPDAPTPPS